MTAPGTPMARASERARVAERRPAVVVADLAISFGGAVVSGGVLCTGLARLGHSVTLVTAMETGMVRHLVAPEVGVVTLAPDVSYVDLERWNDRWASRGSTPIRWVMGYLGVVRQILLNCRYTLRLARFCRKGRVRVLHANNGPDLSMTLASILSGAKLVVHLRGPYTPSLTGRPTLVRADRFVAIAKHIAESVAAAGIPPSRVVTLHNPFEAHAPSDSAVAAFRTEMGAGPDTFLVGAVGRVVPWKGQLELLEAVEPLLLECPEVHVVIVGDGADGGEEYLSLLGQWVAARGFEKRVTFAGYRTDVATVYAGLDLLVHSAVEPEPFGRVIVEAMMQGTPVIAAPAGGPSEIITDGVDGLLRNPVDPEGLGQAIRWCLMNRGRARAMGEAGRLSAESRFAVAPYAWRMSRLYDEVLKGRDIAAGSAADQAGF